jgi:hypothetical protein
MTNLDLMLAEHAVARLITRYVHLNDAGRWEELAALYTADGRMNRPTAPESFTIGREAILAAFQSRPPRASRHVVANIVVDVAPDGQSAGAYSQILLFTGEADGDGLPLQSPKPPLVGSYQDRLVLESGTWKFAERRGSLDFRQA